jgi:halogenation protein CepH
VCRLLGVSDELAKAGFTKKRGGTQRWGANPQPWTFAFSVSPKMTGETSYAYQVERSKFDKILLDNARRKGADVREQHAVIDVIDDGDRIAGVSYRSSAGQEGTIRAKFVVDASGNKSRIYLNLLLDGQNSPNLMGIYLSGYFPFFSGTLIGERSTFNALTNPATQFAGTFTYKFSINNGDGSPTGDSVASLTVNSSGTVTAIGKLADGCAAAIFRTLPRGRG